MSLLFIRAVNTEFQSRDDGAEYDRPEQALTVGVESAVSLAADEIIDGKRNVAIEVIVEDERGLRLLRSIVAISVSALLI